MSKKELLQKIKILENDAKKLFQSVDVIIASNHNYLSERQYIECTNKVNNIFNQYALMMGVISNCAHQNVLTEEEADKYRANCFSNISLLCRKMDKMLNDAYCTT